MTRSCALGQVVVEFTVRRGPGSAAAGEGFQPHQAFVRAAHAGSGSAATFRAKVGAVLHSQTVPSTCISVMSVTANRQQCRLVSKLQLMLAIAPPAPDRDLQAAVRP